jgi:alkylation response protein AidB-like acyl-CoA dehydrogenase
VALSRDLGQLIELIKEKGLQDDPVIRQKVADLLIGTEALRLGGMRALTAQMKTGIPGPEGSIGKWEWATLNQSLTELACDVLGPEGLAKGTPWTYRMLRSRANSIEGGTTEVMKNIIAERVLGLPRLR